MSTRVLICLVALGLAAASQSKKPAQPTYIPPIFHEPIEWSGQMISADLDCDGAPDTLTLGMQPVTRYHFFDEQWHPQKAAEVVLRVERASAKAAPASKAQPQAAAPDKARSQANPRSKAKAKPARDNTIAHIPFLKTTGYYGFCSGPKEITREPLSCAWEGRPLPGCEPRRRCEAVRLRDECSEFLVFWNWEQKELSWVRPSPGRARTLPTEGK